MSNKIIEELLLKHFNLSHPSLIKTINNLINSSKSKQNFTNKLNSLLNSSNNEFVNELYDLLGKNSEDVSSISEKRIFNEGESSSNEKRVKISESEFKRVLRDKTENEVDEEELELIERERVLLERQQIVESRDLEILNEEFKDLQERDEFMQKLNNSTNISTKDTSRDTKLPNLREISRQEYLKKREEEKLLQVELEIQEEERLFSTGISKKERDLLEQKKKLLELVKEKRDEGEEGEDEFYHIPDATKISNKKDKNFLKKDFKEEKSEQILIEEKKISNATLKFGQNKVEEEDYDYVFDESQHVAFVLDSNSTPYDLELEKYKSKIKDFELKRLSIKETQQSLPIYKYKQELLNAIKEYKVVIVIGETGSGKTTQLPQYLIEAGYCVNGKIGCTQPRRVAAMSVANRVAEEMGVKLGSEVGYSIRFEDYTSEKTVLKYMTDGMLLREFLTDPDLLNYSVMIIDEAHERTLHTDILFPLVKDLCRSRDDFRLIISSATMDAEKFSIYFDNAPTFNVPGRKFPVDVYYTKNPEADYISACITTILQIHITQDLGDILVFLTGQDEIEFCKEALLKSCKSLKGKIREMIICPIYSTMQSEEQAKIFAKTPEGCRKVVLATNIAETSITIDDIVYVIDTGFVKQKSYNPKTGMESLQVVPCSKAAANQRMGRAGRVRAGKCFRLYTKWAYFKELEDNPVPEIQRTNLSNVVLLLKSLGLDNILGFEFMDKPSLEGLSKALEVLYSLGALNSKGLLTKVGRKMAEFPVDPILSKALISSEKFKCSFEVVSIISMLPIQNTLFFSKKEQKAQAENARKSFWKADDFLTLLNVWNLWSEVEFSKNWCFENFLQYKSLCKARLVRDQLISLMERCECQLVSILDTNIDSTVNTDDIIRKAITQGFFLNAAKLDKSGSYRTYKDNHSVYIHPSSCCYKSGPVFICYYELVLTSKEYVRQVMEVKGEWLSECGGHYYVESKEEGNASEGDKRIKVVNMKSGK